MEALSTQIGIAYSITRILSVLEAVGFYDEACRITDKIHDIVVYRFLASKLECSKPPVT